MNSRSPYWLPPCLVRYLCCMETRIPHSLLIELIHWDNFLKLCKLPTFSRVCITASDFLLGLHNCLEPRKKFSISLYIYDHILLYIVLISERKQRKCCFFNFCARAFVYTNISYFIVITKFSIIFLHEWKNAK